MSYAPFTFETTDVGELCRWVNSELRLLAAELKKYEIVEYNAAPTERFHTMIVLADGTNWNPGSGRGLYYFDSSDSSWNFLG